MENQGGGAICLDDSNYAVVKNSNCTGNYANFSGGAIFVIGTENVVIDGCIFINNTAYHEGGAVFLKHDNNSVIKNCNFLSNEVTYFGNEDIPGSYGGAIRAHGVNLTIMNSNFDSNFVLSNAVGAGVDVTFNVNGVFYTRHTGADGVAKLNINLQPGDYVITAEYLGCKVSNSIKVLPVLTAKDLTKKYGSSNQFVAVLVDGHGKPYGGQSVSFNINGVIYHRTTDSAGHAKLNINLMAGQYIITSSYNGQNVANTVTVNA